MYLCAWCRSPVGTLTLAPLPQCLECSRHIVNDDAQASSIFAEVIAWVETVFGAGRLREVKLNYGSLPSKRGSVTSVGRTEFMHLNGVSRLKIATIKDLPDFVLAATLAHEIGHVLLFVDDKTLDPNPHWPTDDEVVEGFCEVVASEWLESRTDRNSRLLRRAMNSNPTPVYGPGFRMMRSEFDRAGSLVLLRAELTTGLAKVPSRKVLPPSTASPTPVAIAGVSASDEGVSRHRPVILIDRVQPQVTNVNPGSTNDRPVIPMNKNNNR